MSPLCFSNTFYPILNIFCCIKIFLTFYCNNTSHAKDKIQKTPEFKAKDQSVKKHGSPAEVAKPTDSKLEEMDQKWSEHFSRLEAMLLSKTFNQPQPVFEPVVSPAKPPPANAVDNTQPFLEPKLTDRLVTLHQQPALRPKSDNWSVLTH